jgi:hypothetical protein
VVLVNLAALVNLVNPVVRVSLAVRVKAHKTVLQLLYRPSPQITKVVMLCSLHTRTRTIFAAVMTRTTSATFA